MTTEPVIDELHLADDIDLLSAAIAILHLATRQIDEGRDGSALSNLDTAGRILGVYLDDDGDRGTLEAATALLALLGRLDDAAASINDNNANAPLTDTIVRVSERAEALADLIIRTRIDQHADTLDQRTRALRETPPPAGGPRNMFGQLPPYSVVEHVQRPSGDAEAGR